MSSHRTVLGMALAAGHDLVGKGELCFSQGEFQLAATAFNAACTAYLQGNIHDKDKPTSDSLASILRKRIQASVAVCVTKRQKAQSLAEILRKAETEEADAAAKAEERDFGSACDMLRRAGELYDDMGEVYVGRAAAARDLADQHELQRLRATEDLVVQLMWKNDYGTAGIIFSLWPCPRSHVLSFVKLSSALATTEGELKGENVLFCAGVVATFRPSNLS